jgi:hypothetical protein
MDEDTVADDLVGEGQVNVSKFRTSPVEQDCTSYSMKKSCNCSIKAKRRVKYYSKSVMDREALLLLYPAIVGDLHQLTNGDLRSREETSGDSRLLMSRPPIPM